MQRSGRRPRRASAGSARTIESAVQAARPGMVGVDDHRPGAVVGGQSHRRSPLEVTMSPRAPAPGRRPPGGQREKDRVCRRRPRRRPSVAASRGRLGQDRIAARRPTAPPAGRSASVALAPQESRRARCVIDHRTSSSTRRRRERPVAARRPSAADRRDGPSGPDRGSASIS